MLWVSASVSVSQDGDLFRTGQYLSIEPQGPQLHIVMFFLHQDYTYYKTTPPVPLPIG